MRVLIVDDVALMRLLLSDILIKYCQINRGYIHEATDGVSALGEYKKVRPNMVFLDVLMPNQNGLEAVKHILEFDPSAYIVMVSSATEENVVKECLNNGAIDFIIKPLEPGRVQLSIEKYKNEWKYS